MYANCFVNQQKILYNLPDKTDTEKKRWSNRWAKPISEIEGEWSSKFKLFAPKKGLDPSIIKFITTPKNITPSGIKTWWSNVKRKVDIEDQVFSKERHNFLGNDLAAAHFIIYRKGSVKFFGTDKWLKLDEDDDECEGLPKFNVPDLYVSHIDCSNMNIYYEGLQNLVRLQKLTWLSFRNCKTIDDFCLDRISGEYGDTLKYLDISGCSITERGLNALYRLMNLETLIVTNVKESISFELTCAMLEELYPKLIIKSMDESVKQVE
ncbi:distal membrane-arm assembly complex protein 2-like [Ctenocephalides felis]|uniref:distal membrane-arm assembly complex protein 2-like n=1 Tax=Ctenocephalides felis TaxID=7515 RepID=UPI000E6E1481|nr:distal membrane-arm assembly complex protein 2-like [Ctenocephalides felis]